MLALIKGLQLTCQNSPVTLNPSAGRDNEKQPTAFNVEHLASLYASVKWIAGVCRSAKSPAVA